VSSTRVDCVPDVAKVFRSFTPLVTAEAFNGRPSLSGLGPSDVGLSTQFSRSRNSKL
jgi:hypothetical protein